LLENGLNLKGWYSVAEGELTEKEINNLNIKLKYKCIEAEHKWFKGLVLPKKKRLLQRAENDADLYFQINYCSGDNNE
jgi:hypothetical protein